MESGQFNLSTKEFNSLLLQHPNNDSIKYQLLHSYRRNQDFSGGLAKLQIWQENDSQLFSRSQYISTLDTTSGFLFFQEKMIMLFESRLFQNTIDELDAYPSLSANYYFNNFRVSAYLALEDWSGAQNIMADLQEGDLHRSVVNLVDQSTRIRRKSPFLAASMSTIIPGTGKIYTEKWRDGLFALLFVSSNAFIAYRGFNRTGITSAYGWIFGGVGFSFYLANIYGSAKEARNFNNNQRRKISNRAYENLRYLY
jgi:TM2 domain-containing membrane protein YozV